MVRHALGTALAAGAAALYAAGCAPSLRTLPIASTAGPYGHAGRIDDDTFTFPDTVFSAMPFFMVPSRNVYGFYNPHYLPAAVYAIKRMVFEDEVRARGYTADAAQSLGAIATTLGAIVLRESLFGQPDSLVRVLTHERFHRAFDALPAQEQAAWESIARDIISANNEYGALSQWNPREFWPGLAEGRFPRRVEQAIAQKNPDTYRLFQALKKKSRPRAVPQQR